MTFISQTTRKNLKNKLKINKMNTKTKKPVVMKAEPIQTETPTVTVTKKTAVKKVVANEVDKQIHTNMINLETAYKAAISGKMKFWEVKSMFKKLHKEIKKSTKK